MSPRPDARIARTAATAAPRASEPAADGSRELVWLWWIADHERGALSRAPWRIAGSARDAQRGGAEDQRGGAEDQRGGAEDQRRGAEHQRRGAEEPRDG